MRRDRIAVHGAARQRAQDEEGQRALEDVLLRCDGHTVLSMPSCLGKRVSAWTERLSIAMALQRDRCHHFVTVAAIFDRGEAQPAGHDDAAAVRVERALRLDLQEPLPVEAVPFVANGEDELARMPLVA